MARGREKGKETKERVKAPKGIPKDSKGDLKDPRRGLAKMAVKVREAKDGDIKERGIITLRGMDTRGFATSVGKWGIRPRSAGIFKKFQRGFLKIRKWPRKLRTGVGRLKSSGEFGTYVR